MTITHHVFAMPAIALSLETDAVASTAPSHGEGHMQLPFLSTKQAVDHTEVDDHTVENASTPVEPFRVLADFQDVIDAAADAGLIDDEAAVVFHRQLIAWSRSTAEGGAPIADDIALDVIEAARSEAAEVLERAQQEVAQIRALTLAECDDIIDAARTAAAHLAESDTVDAS